MAVILSDPCSISTLSSESPCIQCLSPSQKKILMIWSMAQLLNLKGGGDYTNVNTLSSAAKCYKCEPDSTLQAFQAQSWLDLAVKAGLSLGGTPETVTTEFNALFKCWKCLDPKTVDAAYTLLLCKIIQYTVILL